MKNVRSKPSAVALLVLGLTCARLVHADTLPFDPDGERIMQVVLTDGLVMKDALIIYPTIMNDWYLPLGELADSLDLAIRVAPSLGQADGFVIEPSRAFHLDTRACTVRYQGRTERYDCRNAVVHQDEIYVDRGLLARWLPAALRVNGFRSQVVVDPREKLPAQARRERERNAERSKGLKADYDPGYPRVGVPRAWLDGPFLDEQLVFSAVKTSGLADQRIQHTTQLGGELLGLEAYALLSGDGKKIDTKRFTFSRRWTDGQAGPAGLREAQLVDIVLPLVPLLSDGKPGRGFLLSTYPVYQPNTFQSTTLEGPLPAGWEVELYRNGVLIDRQVSEGTQRFLFPGVVLFYGSNLFRLAFYGPQGERRDEYRSVNISSALVRKGEGHYRIAFGTLNDSRQRLNVQYAQNVSGTFTTTGGMLYDGRGQRSFGYASLAGYNDYFLFTTTCAFATDGGKACEWGQQLGYGNLAGAWRYTRLFNFTSDLFSFNTLSALQDSEINLNLGYSFPTTPGIGLFSELVKRNFTDGNAQTISKNRLAFSGDRFYWSNTLDYQLGVPSPLSGRWEITYLPGLVRYALGMDYSQSRTSAVDVAAFYTGSEYTLSAQVRYPFDTNRPTYNLSASRRFPWLAAGLNVNYTDGNNYGVSLLTSLGIGRDPVVGNWHVSRDGLVPSGSALVRVFLDRNRNGILDPDEPPVPGVAISVNQRTGVHKTGEDGTAFVAQLAPHAPADIAVAVGQLKDPNLKLGQTGARIIPRASKTAQVDLPLVVVGQIDGNVTTGDRPRRGIRLELSDPTGKVLQTAKTDRDGFFAFEDVAPGRYWLRAEAPRKTEPARREVEIPEVGSFETGQDFKLLE